MPQEGEACAAVHLALYQLGFGVHAPHLAGWDTEPCQDLDDWSLWATLTWML